MSEHYIKCPRCRGTGLVITNHDVFHNPIEYIVCEECHGAGYLEAVDVSSNIKVYNTGNTEGLRDKFCDAVKEVFPDSSLLLDYLEEYENDDFYSVYTDGSGDNYIINGLTGEYVMWYKTTHIGRAMVSTCCPERFVGFLKEFKERCEKNE